MGPSQKSLPIDAYAAVANPSAAVGDERSLMDKAPCGLYCRLFLQPIEKRIAVAKRNFIKLLLLEKLLVIEN